jgi:hypothetical protein
VPLTPLLGITELAPNQTGKEATINTAILALEAATNGTLAVDMSAGDVTLSVSQFMSAFIFNATGLTAARALKVPALVNGSNTQRVFCVQNPSGFLTTVAVVGGAGATVSIPAGENRLLSVDGNGNIVVVGMPPSATTFVNDATTNHNIALADSGSIIRMSNAAANTVTVQPDATVNLAIGTKVWFVQTGTGVSSAVAGAGVTIHSSASLALRARYSLGLLTKTAANTWDLSGDLSGMGAVILDQLNDVDTTTVAPVNKDGLVWNSADSLWEPKAVLLFPDAATARHTLGLLRVIPFWFGTAPNSNEIIAMYACADIFTIPANLAGSQVVMLASGSPPGADMIFDVRKNNVSIGSVTIQSGGTVVLAGTGTTTAAGDIISFHAPATVQPAILNWAINIVGVL